MEKSLYMKEEKLMMTFKMLDIDGNGKISKNELKTVLGGIYNSFIYVGDDTYKNKDDYFWDEMIAEVDTNGDGEVIIYFLIMFR